MRLRCRLKLCRWHLIEAPKGQCCIEGLDALPPHHPHICVDIKKRQCMYCGRVQTYTLDTMGDPAGEYWWKDTAGRISLPPGAQSKVPMRLHSPWYLEQSYMLQDSSFPLSLRAAHSRKADGLTLPLETPIHLHPPLTRDLIYPHLLLWRGSLGATTVQPVK